MSESTRIKLIQDIFSGMAERGMSQVMPQRDGFGKVFIKIERPADGAGYLRDLQGVSQPGDIMVADRGDKDLGLMF